MFNIFSEITLSKLQKENRKDAYLDSRESERIQISEVEDILEFEMRNAEDYLELERKLHAHNLTRNIIGLEVVEYQDNSLFQLHKFATENRLNIIKFNSDIGNSVQVIDRNGDRFDLFRCNLDHEVKIVF